MGSGHSSLGLLTEQHVISVHCLGRSTVKYKHFTVFHRMTTFP